MTVEEIGREIDAIGQKLLTLKSNGGISDPDINVHFALLVIVHTPRDLNSPIKTRVLDNFHSKTKRDIAIKAMQGVWSNEKKTT